MIRPPKCYERGCKHYLGVSQPKNTEKGEKPVCVAYPDGIPTDIAYGDDPHTEVRKDQDNKITFQKKDE